MVMVWWPIHFWWIPLYSAHIELRLVAMHWWPLWPGHYTAILPLKWLEQEIPNSEQGPKFQNSWKCKSVHYLNWRWKINLCTYMFVNPLNCLYMVVLGLFLLYCHFRWNAFCKTSPKDKLVYTNFKISTINRFRTANQNSPICQSDRCAAARTGVAGCARSSV